MDAGIFSEIDKDIEAAGTRDFKVIAERRGYMPYDLAGSILGIASHYYKIPTIGVNAKLKDKARQFAGWHEMGHVLAGHIWEPGVINSGLHDFDFFTEDFNSKTISQNEMVANLISAHACIETEEALDAIGYYSKTLKQYRRLKVQQDQVRREYENLLFTIDRKAITGKVHARLKSYQRALSILEREKQGLEYELMDMNTCKTFSEMAASLDTTERILRYKLEALRLLDYDIDPQELESYTRMFEGVLME